MHTELESKGKAWSNFQDTETAPLTKKFYARWIGLFMDHCGVEEPDELLQLGTVNETEGIIIKWLGTLKDSGKATATMKGALAIVAFFYSCNRMRIDTKFVGRRIPKKPGLPHRSPTKQEIATIVESANMRGKVLAGVLASSGVRIGAIPPLKRRHTRKVTPEELEHQDCNCKDRSQSL